MPTRSYRVAGVPVLCLGLSALAGCGAERINVLPIGSAEVTQLRADVPPGAPEGTCWDRDSTPAVIETVTEQVMVSPPELVDGQVVQPAVYRTETHQAIVRERDDVWFRTPCAADMTPDFVASLQRALSVRGFYDGPVTGQMDQATRRAVHAYQKPEGLDSGTLSLAAARNLGLAVIEVPGVDDRDPPATVPG